MRSISYIDSETKEKRVLRCAFCNRSDKEVARLFYCAGDRYICDICCNTPRNMIAYNEILELFTKTGAFMEGHFLLSSGFHSEKYVQCIKALQFPDVSSRLCSVLADKFKNRVKTVEVVVGPALGAVTLAYEVARYLHARALFTEREKGTPILRRGFEIRKDENVLIVEDVLTTGGTVKEVMEVVSDHGGIVVGVGALVDRSERAIQFGVPTHALLPLSVEKFAPDGCPLCEQGIPIVKPGSRKTKVYVQSLKIC